MSGDRITAQHRVAGLLQVAGAEGQSGKHGKRNASDIDRGWIDEDSEDQRPRMKRGVNARAPACRGESPLDCGRRVRPEPAACVDVIRPPKRFYEFRQLPGSAGDSMRCSANLSVVGYCRIVLFVVLGLSASIE
jgi:hypothetical protein